ncbi:MAG: protein kinase, partial [Planctomycetota bacterium]
MDDLTGQSLGDYRIYRRLGRGAMADVYLAQQASLERHVALKVLSAQLARDETYVARFQQEARAAASLVHGNIVQIYEVGVVDERHFIAQEYVAGSNLGELIRREGRVEPGVVLDILRQ